ncbi:MAG: mechanosensitive ion channel [Halothece sp.]
MLFNRVPKLLAQETPSPQQSPDAMQATQDWLTEFAREFFSQDVKSLVYALLTLVIGWILAWAIGRFVRTLLKKTNIDDRIATWLTGQQGEEPIPIENWIGDTVKWIIRLFVIVAALQPLQLEAVTEPLNTLLNEITGFLPQIGAAAILLGLAWVVASLVKIFMIRLLRTFDLDQRFNEQVGTSESDLTLSETIGNTLYWLIFLLFLPSILSTLQLQGTLGPVQELVNGILSVLPNIFAAILIVAIGWLIAQLVRKIVTNLVISTGADQLGTRFGLSEGEDSPSLSWIIGTVVYVLILIPVAIAGLERLQIQAISQPAVAMLDQVLNTLPKIFTATLVLIIAYFIAQYISEFVSNILSNVGFNNLFSWLGLQRPASTSEGEEAETMVTDQGEGSSSSSAIQNRTPSELMGIVVLVGIMLFATLAAVNILNIPALTELVSGIVLVSGKIIAGLIIFAIGLYFANVAFNLILSSGMQQSRTLAQAGRIVIIAFSLALGLQQMGIAPNIVNLAFGLLLGSVAVAIALAFGLGSREIAAEQVREWINNFKSSRNQ